MLECQNLRIMRGGEKKWCCNCHLFEKRVRLGPWMRQRTRGELVTLCFGKFLGLGGVNSWADAMLDAVIEREEECRCKVDEQVGTAACKQEGVGWGQTQAWERGKQEKKIWRLAFHQCDAQDSPPRT